jgi:hypothetical protein
MLKLEMFLARGSIWFLVCGVCDKVQVFGVVRGKLSCDLESSPL